jgi:hypothetical protein
LILFLDYDGVLHPDPCLDGSRLFENAPRLAETLAPYPEVGVVLSTSWRNVKKGRELLEPLPQALRLRILGRTPNFSEFNPPAALIPYRRQAECVQWLVQHNMADCTWWALDDRADWFRPYSENLLQCDPRIGFDEQDSVRLSSRMELARQRAARGLDLELV